MTCSDARALLPGLALGDLDAEPARELEVHLRGCADCRSAQAGALRTVAALRAPAALPPSTERRAAAVAAMAKAQAGRAEAALVRPRRAWLPWTAAAAFLLALAAVLFRPSPGPDFRVDRVAGRADLYLRDRGVWRALEPGEAIRAGDRVVTQSATVVLLAVEGGAVHLDQNTSVEMSPGRRLTLDRGRLYVELASGAAPLVVSDTANNSVTLRQGALEADLGEVRALVGGSQETKDGKSVPPVREETARRLVARVTAGEVDLGGALDQRLRATAGQVGSFSAAGQPAAGALPSGDVASWRAPGFYADRR
jgi:hypothetical protein